MRLQGGNNYSPNKAAFSMLYFMSWPVFCVSVNRGLTEPWTDRREKTRWEVQTRQQFRSSTRLRRQDQTMATPLCWPSSSEALTNMKSASWTQFLPLCQRLWTHLRTHEHSPKKTVEHRKKTTVKASVFRRGRCILGKEDRLQVYKKNGVASKRQ